MKYKNRSQFETAYAYVAESLIEAEWGIPPIANRASVVPLVFDLFPTYPAVNRNRMAITYPTAQKSLPTIAYNLLNKDHVMKGTPLDLSGNYFADRDSTLGVMLAARWKDAPAEEVAVFIDKPAIAQVLGALWPMTEIGAEVTAKMRAAVAKGEKFKIGASFEVWYNDIGFVWNNKIYQAGMNDTEEDEAIYNDLWSTLEFGQDGTLKISRSYNGQWPVLLLGGAQGTVLFHGAAIIVDEEPAYPETLGQFQIFAKHANRYLEAVCKAGDNTPEDELTLEELKQAIAAANTDLFTQIKGMFDSKFKEATAENVSKVAEAAVAQAEEMVTKGLNKLQTELEGKFVAAEAKARADTEKAVRERIAVETKAFADIMEYATKANVTVKPKAECKDNERVMAREDVDEMVSKDPSTALVFAKAKIADLPNLPQRGANANNLPSGGSGLPDAPGAPSIDEILAGAEVS